MTGAPAEPGAPVKPVLWLSQGLQLSLLVMFFLGEEALQEKRHFKTGEAPGEAKLKERRRSRGEAGVTK